VADEKSTEGARQGAGGPSIGATEDQAEAAEDPAGGASAASGWGL